MDSGPSSPSSLSNEEQEAVFATEQFVHQYGAFISYCVGVALLLLVLVPIVGLLGVVILVSMCILLYIGVKLFVTESLADQHRAEYILLTSQFSKENLDPLYYSQNVEPLLKQFPQGLDVSIPDVVLMDKSICKAGDWLASYLLIELTPNSKYQWCRERYEMVRHKFSSFEIQMTKNSVLNQVVNRISKSITNLFVKKKTGARATIPNGQEEAPKKKKWTKVFAEALAAPIVKLQTRSKQQVVQAKSWDKQFELQSIHLVINVKTLEQFLKKRQVMRNKSTVLAFHGTKTSNINGICKSGFYDPESFIAKMKKLDPGYFGSGIYFSSVAAYASIYFNFSTQGPAANQIFKLLVCEVIRGESFAVKDLSKFGDGCEKGYDSHHVLVQKQALDKEGNVDYLPYQKGFLNTLLGKYPCGDELVIFNSNQICPRYIITAQRQK